MRRSRVRRVLRRAMRWRRPLCLAEQRLRPATVSTPRTVALVQDLPPLGTRAVRARHARAALSATTVALGGGGGAKGGALAVLDVLGKEVRVAGEALHDLTASGGAGGAFEVVDVHLDLAFELARQRNNDLADGVQ